MVKFNGAQRFYDRLLTLERKAGDKAHLVRKKVGMDLLRNIIQRSPRDTGRFQGSWRVAQNKPDLSVARETGQKESIQPDISGESAKIEKSDNEARLYITNALPYAIPLEKGWSKTQAPLGIVRIAIIDVESQLPEIISNTK